MCAAWVNNPPYPPYIEGFRNTKVENNTLTNISITGMWLESGFVNDCLISNNLISLTPWSNYGISSDGYNNRYTGNVITGAGLKRGVADHL